jgi:hypothetical protein
VSFLGLAGATKQVVVGMRVGATIAVNAGIGSGLDALVLWDACASGARFVREHQVLLKMIDPTDGMLGEGVELPGHVLTDATAADLSSLRLEALPKGLARRLLVLERPGRPLDARARDHLSSERAEWAEATGQSELLEAISPRDSPPLATIGSICTWLDRVIDDARLPVAVPRVLDRAVVGRTADGMPVTERVVRLGPLGLVGLMTESESATHGPVVIMLNDGHEHHVGPARLWVDLARRWGSLGIQSVRVDVSGIGDSPLRPGQKERVCYPPEIFDDVAGVASDLRPDDPRDVVLMGVCSGAYHAIDCGIDLRVRGVCAINPGLAPNPRRLARSVQPTVPRVVALLSSIHPRLSHALLLAVAQVSPRRSAAGSLFLLEPRGTSSLIVCGDDEARQFQRLTHWDRTLRRLTSGGRFRFEHVKGLQHSLLNADPRAETVSLLTSFVVSLAEAGPPVADGADAERAADAGHNGSRGGSPIPVPDLEASA